MTQQPDKTGKKQGGRTRFKPGQSGNPQGRKLGSRNKVSALVDTILEDQAQELAQVALQKAMDGDAVLIKALLDRVCPPRKERTVSLDLPSIDKAQEVPGAMKTILQATAAGELEPGQAATLIQALGGHLKALEMTELEQRLETVEKSLEVDR